MMSMKKAIACLLALVLFLNNFFTAFHFFGK